MSEIDFYFDFISPFAYLAATYVEALGKRHHRTVNWRPFRLGVAVVKVMGLKPLMDTPLKGEYSIKDLARLATLLGERLALPQVLPDPRPAARLFYSAAPECCARLAKALLRAQWADGFDIGNTTVLVRIASEAGLDPLEARDALVNPVTKEALSAATKAAIERGIFGSPTCAVGPELFWGTDRLWLLDRYLAAGERYQQLDPPTRVILGFDRSVDDCR
jgi:2-hydroxychromene-2-carboxylate isomerase